MISIPKGQTDGVRKDYRVHVKDVVSSGDGSCVCSGTDAEQLAQRSLKRAYGLNSREDAMNLDTEEQVLGSSGHR